MDRHQVSTSESDSRHRRLATSSAAISSSLARGAAPTPTSVAFTPTSAATAPYSPRVAARTPSVRDRDRDREGATAARTRPAAAAAPTRQPSFPTLNTSSNASTAAASAVRYRCGYDDIRYLSGGSFGLVYSAYDTRAKRDVAIKIERIDTAHPQLRNEYLIYTQWLAGKPGFPKVYKFWKTRSHNCMTMEMLGDNLFDRFCQCSYQFSKKTIYMIAIQVLERLEDLHGTGHVHRDLKPENMVVGEDGGIIHLIDIGLAKPFMDPRTGRHVKKNTRHTGLTGTARYAAVGAHGVRDTSRKNDLESLAYILVYFLHGRLPWQGIQGDTKRQRHELVYEKKMNTSTATLCAGWGCPALETFVRYTRRELSYVEEPPYHDLRKMFSDELEKEGAVYLGLFDWQEPPRQVVYSSSESSYTESPVPSASEDHPPDEAQDEQM